MRMMMLISMLLHLSRMVVADLITTPKDTESSVGAQTFFNCSTTLRSNEIQWFHYDVGSDQERHLVYGFDQFHGTFQQRCRIERNEAVGEYNLVIESVSNQDAGKFECQDNMGRGAKASSQLSVLETVPVCESNMKDPGIIVPNSGGIEPQELHLTCTVDYRGNQSPQMIWKKSGSNDAITEGVTQKTVNDTRVTYSLTLKANRDIDGQTFVCETTKSVSEQCGCNSDRVKITGSNTVFVILITVLIFLGLSLTWNIVSIMLLRKKKKGNGAEVPAVYANEPSENYELLYFTQMKQGSAVQDKLNRAEDECKHLQEKVSQYEKVICAGGIRYKEKPELIHETSVQPAKDVINGITILIDDLFAIFENSPDILVYDSITSNQKSNKVHVNDLWNPEDIASCSTNNCLYVIDQLKGAEDSHLLKIDPKGNQPTERWYNTDCHGGRLSVYKTNVIVCLPAKCAIIEYAANGDTLHTIHLSPDDGFDQLCCAIQVEESNFIVNYFNNSNNRQNLCLVDRNGGMVAPVNNADTLETSICLITDRAMFVLVLLNDGKKSFLFRDTKDLVLLLNPKLEYKRTLVEHSSDAYGVGMCLDSTGLRLFVAVNSRKPSKEGPIYHRGRILFYNIQ